jgi:hypothetical protein
MLEIKYGRKEEPGIVLRQSADLVVLRLRGARPRRLPPTVRAELTGADLVLEYADVAVYLFQLRKSAAREKSLAARKAALQRLPEVHFAGSVLVDDASEEALIYTENIFVKFVDSLSEEECRGVLQSHALEIAHVAPYARNAFLTWAPEGTGQTVFELALSLLNRADVEYCHPEVVREREPKRIFPRQWSLKRAKVGRRMVDASANIAAAHKVTTGEGTTIAVIDDGVDIDHPEFAIAGKIVAPRDILSDTADPRPRDTDPEDPDDHGTCCAGVACAAGVDGASGVAPGARLMPIRIPADLESFQEGLAIWHAARNGADVISCSWGAVDGDLNDEDDPLHFRLRTLPPMTRLAIDYAVTKGRNGRGCVICFAAGNGGESVDNDGYASHEQVIAVAASNHKSVRCDYSDHGNALWCTFPGGDDTAGIWTTDRLGKRGETSRNYTGGFFGTSAACPGAAGVAALVLSVNPELRWDEVRDIMRRACDRIDRKNGRYDKNGHSPFYGYGRLNGAKAVALAQSAKGDRIRITRRRVLPAAGSLVMPFHVGEQARVQDLFVRVDTLRPAGRLALTLQPPRQPRARHIVLNDGAAAVGAVTQTFGSAEMPALSRLRNKSAKGLWRLEIRAAERGRGAMPLTCSLELALRPAAARGTRR